MPEPRRTPWIAIDVDIRKDDRIVDLPSDGARYGYVAGVLAEAKLQSPRGMFASRALLAEAIGRFDRFVPKYLEVGLLHTGGKLCSECRDAFGQVAPKAIVVHNWHGKQRDSVPMPTERQTPAERTALWRLRTAVFERDQWSCRYCGKGEYPRGWLVAEHVLPDGPADMDNLVTACRPCNKRKGPRTPEEAGMALLPEPRPDSHGDDDGDAPGDSHNGGHIHVTSRARAETPDIDTRHQTPKEDPVVPRVTPRASRAAGSSSAAPSDEPIDQLRPDVAALRQRGWTRLSDEQLASLDEVADYERSSEYDVVSGQRVVAGWILAAPRGAELLSHVFATSRRLRDERQAEADRRAEVHEQQKRATLHARLGGAT